MMKENKKDIYVYPLLGNMYINLTNRCCNDCTFCLRNNGESVQGNVLWLNSEPTGAQVIEAIKKADFEYKEIVFCGYGESTYRLDVMLEVAEFVKTLNKKVRLNTNGLGDLICGQKIAEKLKGYIDIVSISLNESTAEKYQQLCRSRFKDKAFSAIISFAKDCVSAGLDTRFTVVDVIGEKAIEECKKIAVSVSVKLKIRKHIVNNETYN